MDWRNQKAEWEQSRNPFAVVTQAHLKTPATQHDPAERYRWKWRLLRELYERGLSREDVVALFHLARISEPTVLEDLGEALLDCADGVAGGGGGKDWRAVAPRGVRKFYTLALLGGRGIKPARLEIVGDLQLK